MPGTHADGPENVMDCACWPKTALVAVKAQMIAMSTVFFARILFFRVCFVAWRGHSLPMADGTAGISCSASGFSAISFV